MIYETGRVRREKIPIFRRTKVHHVTENPKVSFTGTRDKEFLVDHDPRTIGTDCPRKVQLIPSKRTLTPSPVKRTLERTVSPTQDIQRKESVLQDPVGSGPGGTVP